MMLSILPTQTFAASVENPWKTATVNNNAFLDALKYLGYNTSQFTVNGKYGSNVASSDRTGIGYNSGGATGYETSSGKPNIATFKSKGMCCASYATYVYFNYLPNVYGLDTSFLTKPSNGRSTSDWYKACEQWVKNGDAKKTTINKSCSSANNLKALDSVAIGSILIFTDNNGNYSHTGLYAGKKGSNYFQTNVGNSRGPEVQLVNGFSSGPSSYANLLAAYTPEPPKEVEKGYVGVRKVDDIGNAVSGAKIGVYSDKNCTNLLTTLTTDSSGNAKYDKLFDEGTTIYFKEIFAPTGYDISTQVVSATVVADKTTYASTKIVDKRQFGAVGVIKVDDAGNRVKDAKIGVYSDNACKNLVTTVTTDANGKAVYGISDGEYQLRVGDRYYFKEISAPTGYDLSTQVVSAPVLKDRTTWASEDIVDKRQFGAIAVIKEDDTGNGVPGKGARVKGAVIGVYSDRECKNLLEEITTDANGTAKYGIDASGEYFLRVGNVYYFKEISAPEGYDISTQVAMVKVVKSKGISWAWDIEDSDIPNNSDRRNLIDNRQKGFAEVIKTSEDGIVEGVEFRLNGTADIGTAVDVTAKTDSTGKATFSNVLIGTYTIEEINVPDRYVAQKSQTVTIKNGQTASVTFNNTLKRGNIELTKVDEEYPDNKLSGAEFTVTITKDGETTTQKMTEVSKGVYRLENIAYGSECVIKETVAPEGFVLSDETFTVNITEEKTYTVASEGFEAVINRPIKGSLKIVKVDSFNNTPLEGVGYRLFNSDGEQVEEGYTNENGELVFEGLRYGDYSYQEFKAPEGFVLDDTVYDFSVTTDGQVITAQRENSAVEGSILIHKTDMNGNVLSDVSFLLEYSTDGGKTYSPVFSRNVNDTVSVGGCTSAELQHGVLVTDENGEAYFTGLRISTQTGNILYRVTETKTQIGYQLLSDYAFEGELTENGDIDIEFTVVNSPIFVLPATGGTGFAVYTIIGITAALVAVLCIYDALKKKKFKRNRRK